MAILTAKITFTDKETKQEYKEVHAIGYFLENDNGKIVYSDGEVIDKDDLQGFIKDKLNEYIDLLHDDDRNNYYTEFYNFIIHSTDIEYGAYDDKGHLGRIRTFK